FRFLLTLRGTERSLCYLVFDHTPFPVGRRGTGFQGKEERKSYDGPCGNASGSGWTWIWRKRRPNGTMKVMTKHFSSILAVAATAILFGAAASAQQSLAQGSTEVPGSTSKPAASGTPKSSTAGPSTGAAKTGQAGATAKKPATAAGTTTLLKTDKDRRSYAIGLNIGAKVANELKSGGVDMD